MITLTKNHDVKHYLDYTYNTDCSNCNDDDYHRDCEIVDFNMLDCGANYCTLLKPEKNKVIQFDLDDSGKAPWINIKLFKKFAKIIRGLDLDYEEDGKKYFYDGYTHIADLSDDIATDVRKYFESFKCMWVRK